MRLQATTILSSKIQTTHSGHYFNSIVGRVKTLPSMCLPAGRCATSLNFLCYPSSHREILFKEQNSIESFISTLLITSDTCKLDCQIGEEFIVSHSFKVFQSMFNTPKSFDLQSNSVLFPLHR